MIQQGDWTSSIDEEVEKILAISKSQAYALVRTVLVSGAHARQQRDPDPAHAPAVDDTAAAEDDGGGRDPAQDEADHQGDQRTHAPMLGPPAPPQAVSPEFTRPDGAVFTWVWELVHPGKGMPGRTRC